MAPVDSFKNVTRHRWSNVSGEFGGRCWTYNAVVVCSPASCYAPCVSVGVEQEKAALRDITFPVESFSWEWRRSPAVVCPACSQAQFWPSWKHTVSNMCALSNGFQHPTSPQSSGLALARDVADDASITGNTCTWAQTVVTQTSRASTARTSVGTPRSRRGITSIWLFTFGDSSGYFTNTILRIWRRPSARSSDR